MNRYLLDISTVLALPDPQHEHHTAALGWADRRSDVRLVTLARHHDARFATCDRRITTGAVDGAAEVIELIGT